MAAVCVAIFCLGQKGTAGKLFVFVCGFGNYDILRFRKSAKGMSSPLKLAPLQTSLRQ